MKHNRRRLRPLLRLLAFLLALSACRGASGVPQSAPPQGSPPAEETVPPSAAGTVPPPAVSPDPPPGGPPEHASPHVSPAAPTQPPAASPAPSESPPDDPSPAPAASAPVRNDAYFDDALFLGDSIMEGVRQYVAAQRKEQTTLGGAKFLTSIMGISLADLVGERQPCIYYSYGGKEAPLEELVSGMNVRRVFLLLGLNDLAGTDDPVEEIVDRYTRLLDSLRKTLPEAELIVITNPPKVASAWLPDYALNRSFNNARISEFVAALADMCQDGGIPLVDAYECLVNENGALPDDWCRDGYVHLNSAGSARVVEALYAFAADRT